MVSNEIMAKSGDMVQFGIETSDTVTLELVLPPEITQLTKSKEGPAVDLSASAEVTGDEEAIKLSPEVEKFLNEMGERFDS